MATNKDCWEFTQPLIDETIRVKKELDALQTGKVDKWLQEKITEYPEASIRYSGRSLPFSKTKCEVPVCVLVTPSDPDIIKDLKSWKLWQTGENPETLIPKIYSEIKKRYYKYTSDLTTWGENEVWEFPFESRLEFLKGLDCDSWAIIQLSYYLAAGVPRGYAWIVAGMTSLGGHATVYVHSKKDNKAHHLNSTYGPIYPSVSQYPTHDDAKNGKDKIGISTVWFSFDNQTSRATFSTAGKNKELKKFIFK